jgi:hypothetical protein
LNQAYALTDIESEIGDTATAVEEAKWQAKEIRALFFKRGEGENRFAPLWNTIHV